MARKSFNHRLESEWRQDSSQLINGVTVINSIIIFFIGMLGVRLLTMWFIPLTDTTEARYGEIARKMLETGDWITLWHEYDVPFWAKPPLSTWLSALSMKLLGVNEFAVRLPSMILAVGILLLNWQFTRNYLQKPTQWLSTIVLSSMALFYLASGTVMTDMSLLFTCTLTLVAFWLAVVKAEIKWGYLFFIGLGLGMLAKGPVAVVLSLLPIFCWLVWSNNWSKIWKSLPWMLGIPLMLLIFMPWYILAELKAPGFIEYFIVGEHFKRFLVSGWQGDLYGNAHYETLGTIWLYLIIDALPWLLVPLVIYFISKLKKDTSKQQSILLDNNFNDQQKYLWCWFLTPIIFFSFAHNIIMTYALTALPALAILISQWIKTDAIDEQNNVKNWVFLTGMFSPTVILLVFSLSLIQPYSGKKSARSISQLYQSAVNSSSVPLAYIGGRLYSMEFYNSGKAKSYETIDLALQSVKPQHPLYIAITHSQLGTLNASQKKRLQQVGQTARYRLFLSTAGDANEQ